MKINCSVDACPIILSSTCVFYEGANLIYTGINTNDSVQLAIQKINNVLASSVSNLSVIYPLQTTGGLSPTFSILKSSSTVDGYISSIDWNIFNNKQNAITLTTTGTSGPSTLVGSTLNIPNYFQDLSGYVPISRTLTINGVTYDLSANRTWTIDALPSQSGNSGKYLTTNGSVASWASVTTGTVTSVGLTMPAAFSVANSPVTTSGTLAVSANGVASQYIRGDGQLATFPASSSGGASISYYLNGGVAASVPTYYQMSRTPVIGINVDFTLAGNGLISQFLTDVADPNTLTIPAGNWDVQMYFSASDSTGNPAFYVELLKYDGATFTSIASSAAVPEGITNGVTIDFYVTAMAVPQTTLLVTDRIAIRVYIVNNVIGRTITLHTQDDHLDEIITTFAGGISALNGLTVNTQYLAVGTSGTDFAISSLTDTHTFNLPTASASNRGALSTTDWTTFNNKPNYNIYTGDGTLTSDRTLTGGAYSLTLNSDLYIPGTQKGMYSRLVSTPATGSTGTYSTYNQNAASFLENLFNVSGSSNLSYTQYFTNAVGINNGVGNGQLAIKGVDSDVTLAGTHATNGFLYGLGLQGYVARGYYNDISTNSRNAMAGIQGSILHNSYTNANIYTDTADSASLSAQFSSGTVNKWKGANSFVYVATYTGAKNSVVNNAYGFYSYASVGTTSGPTGLITNYYGIYLDTPTVGATGTITNRWGIYAPDSVMQHYIAGIPNSSVDTDKFLVSDGNVLKYRTGAEVLSDIGAQPSGSYVPTTRSLTINGTTYDLSADRTWSVGTITSITASAPLTGGTITSTGSIGITQSSTSTDGYLSSTDWTTFNGKYTLPSLTSGSVLFSNGTTIAQDNANFFWDDTNNRLGIGTATPANDLHIKKSADVGGKFESTNSSNEAFVVLQNSSSEQANLEIFGSGFGVVSLRNSAAFTTTCANGFAFVINNNSATSNFSIKTTTSLTERFRLFNSTGNVLIQNGGTFTDNGQRLQVQGDVFIKGSGNTSASNALVIQNSSATGLGYLRNDGYLYLGPSTPGLYLETGTNDNKGIVIKRTSGADLSILVSNASSLISSGSQVTIGSTTSGNNAYANFNGNTVLLNSAVGGSGNINLQTNSTNRISITNTLTTINTSTTITGSTTAATAIARGVNITPTLIAAANNDVLVGLDIAPTYTNGAFTGVTNLAARFQDNVKLEKSVNGTLGLNIVNSNAGTSTLSEIGVSNGSSGFSMTKAGTNKTAYKILSANDGYLYNGTGNISILSDAASSIIKFAAGSSTASQMTLFSNGNLGIGVGITDAGYKLDVNGSARISGKLSVNTPTAASAVMEVTSTTQGFLPPRMTNAQVTAITTPATGLLAYATDATEGMYVKLSGAWQRLLTTGDGVFTLPSLTSGSVLFSNGTTISQNNANFFWDNGNQRLGIGTNAPSAIFHSVGTVNSASLIGRGAYFNNTITATANNDVLVGVDINPTFTNGAFTGVTNYGLRVAGNTLISTSVIGDNFKITASSNRSVVYNTDSGGRSFLTVYGDTSATSNAGAYFTANGYQEAWFNVVSTQATSGNKYWRFGNIGSSNYFAIQKLNDAANAITSTALTIFSSTSNIGIGTTTDASYKLDVVGTGRYSDNLLVSKNQNAQTGVLISNTTSGTASQAYLQFTSDASAGTSSIGKYSNTTTTFKIIASKDAYIYNNTAGDISILNDWASGNIKFAAGAVSTAQATLTSGGIMLIGTTTIFASELLQVNSNIRAIDKGFVGGGPNASALITSGYLVNGTNNTPILNLDGTWNSATANPTAILLNITNTASGANAKLIDLQIGSASKFNVAKDGKVRIGSYGSGTITGSPTSILGVDGSGNILETSASIYSLSGTYTPTVSSTSNATVTNIQVAQYMRVGDVVTVSGRMTVAAGNTISSYYLIMNVPITTNFTSATYRCAGTAVRAVVSTNNAGWITGETSDTIRIHFPITASSTATDIHYHFTYYMPPLT